MLEGPSYSLGTNLSAPPLRARRGEGKSWLLSGKARPMGFPSAVPDCIPGKTPWIAHPD